MTADLADRIRSALDDAELTAVHAHLAWPPPDLPPSTREHITRWRPGAVLRLLDAERRVLARHRPVECHCGTDWHTHRCRGCDRPWPCDEIRDQADRLGINTEEETA